MLRMAVVGMGIGGSYGPMLWNNPDAEFAAFCDRDEKKLEWRAKAYRDESGITATPYADMEEMLEKEKLDGVIISTPSGTHHELAVKVIERGINVLIDKPVDICAEHIDEIEAALARRPVIAGVIYPMRLQAVYRGLRKIIREEILGRPLILDMRLRWHRTQEYYDRGGWRGTWKMDGGGSLMNQGAHPMDILCWCLGRPRTVTGEYGVLNHDIETEDWASGIIEFEGGVRSTVSTTTCAAGGDDTITFEYYGQEGRIVIRGHEVVTSSVEGVETLDEPRFDHPVNDFVDAVKNNRAPVAPVSDARVSVDLINAIYTSAREGRRIEFS